MIKKDFIWEIFRGHIRTEVAKLHIVGKLSADGELTMETILFLYSPSTRTHTTIVQMRLESATNTQDKSYMHLAISS